LLDGQKKIILLSETMFSYRLKTAFFLWIWPLAAAAQTDSAGMDELVISGTLKPVKRSESPVPVETLTRSFLRANPGPNIFESLQMVNGLQPQVNCNVCSAGDIHINGMEGPYTLVTIDGMPLMSSLGTVYGLMGIPNSLLQRVEVIRGAASALYGSEAMAGVINLITREPGNKTRWTADYSLSSDAEHSLDLGAGYRIGKLRMLSSLHGFSMSRPFDRNGDGFADIPVQQRYSFFQKMSLPLADGRKASFAFRRFGEYRWGGQMQWEEQFAGTDSVYGERIRTGRTELLGAIELGVLGRPRWQFSFIDHRQGSVYGLLPFNARQSIFFSQLLWDGKFRGWQWLAGLPFRFTRYDDNTPVTARVQHMPLPGAFVQVEKEWKQSWRTNLSLRSDFDRVHGWVWSPRLAIQFKPAGTPHNLRFNIGSGYRVVNVFTEDHAALTGSRRVVFREALNPEQSWSGLISYARTFTGRRAFFRWESSAFYTRFGNKIVADYFTNADQVIYGNLDGYAVSRGLSMDIERQHRSGQRISLGITLLDVSLTEADSTGAMRSEQQVHTPPFSASLQVHQPLNRNWSLDLNGRLFSPMRLPIVPNDYRPEYSPWHGLVNLQFIRKSKDGMELYFGVRNLLNFTPRDPLLRPFDPFDKETGLNNPNGYTFDASYNYASMQGRRVFVGYRMQF
jgi:outer membrane receptor for ferrienterochelin and colicins